MYRKPLELEDIWDLPPGDRIESVCNKFESFWAEELRKPHPSLVCALRFSCCYCLFLHVHSLSAQMGDRSLWGLRMGAVSLTSLCLCMLLGVLCMHFFAPPLHF